jgi:hypothetical protein
MKQLVLGEKDIKIIHRKSDGKSWLWNNTDQKLIKRKCDECFANKRNEGCALVHNVKDCIGCRFFMRPK